MERSRCLRRSRDAHLALFSLHRFASSQSRRFIQFVRPKNEGTHGNRKPTNARRHGLGGHRRQALTVLAVAQHGRCLGRCHAGPATHRPMPLMLRRPFMGSNHPTTPPIPIPHSVGGEVRTASNHPTTPPTPGNGSGFGHVSALVSVVVHRRLVRAERRNVRPGRRSRWQLPGLRA